MATGAEPVPPILASTLFDAAQSERQRARAGKVGTGCKIIDQEVLDGGLRYGKGGVCCISGGRGLGKTGLALHFLTTHLLTHPQSPAYILDTTGTLSVLRLNAILISRLRAEHRAAKLIHTGGHVYERQTIPVAEDEVEDYERRAERLLEMVKVMRVFDFVGVVESLAEIGAEWEDAGRDKAARRGSVGGDGENEKDDGEGWKMGQVRDSQGEEGEEEEMLDEQPTPSMAQTVNTEERSDADPPVPLNEGNKHPTCGIIIIDNITQVVSPLMKSNHIQGHALLTTTLRQLSHLTQTHNLCTLLLNTSITAPNPSLHHQYPYQNTTVATPSIFASNTSRPALGKTFPYFVDLHLFVSRLPKGRRDADIAYGTAKGLDYRRVGDGVVGGGVQWVNVVEVLADRYEGRVGRWAAFRVGGDGVGLEGVV